MRTSEELNRETDPLRVRLAGAIRRFVITLTDAAIWQVTGYRMPDGSTETRNAELFGGIGFAARPPAGGKPEAIGVMVGDASTPVIIAIRDEETRRAVAGALELDESMMFNTTAVMLIKADGTIEARAVGGSAVPLATKADLDALAAYVAKQFAATGTGHTHTLASGGTVTLTTVPTATPGTGHGVPSSAGTSKFKAE